MRAGTLSTLILTCTVVLASTIPGARADEWYQGQPGNWHRHGNTWEWQGKHGDEWLEGKPGHWYAERGGWYWLGDDGREYRRAAHGWEWSGKRHKHSAE